MPAVPRLNFRQPKSKARYPLLPNVRTTTRERGNDFQGWAIFSDGGMVKPQLDGVLLHDLLMED